MADKIVLAACCLHNFLTQDTQETQETLMDESEVSDGNGLVDIEPLNRNPSQEAIQVREAYKTYFAYTALKEAMGIPGLDVNAVITKIKNIRSTYSQEVKKINDSMKSGAGADSIYKPSVKWFDILHDVLRSIKPRK
ncbi:unnamed protein product [Parnassius apollo]|uniref:(apollo) hypothetical protein n=1 Tax=Parnassius apollo TaxID=110799 RepID=A0A8S3W3L9_PARAO|nr:unnamed protein product [Parnassius apollo]